MRFTHGSIVVDGIEALVDGEPNSAAKILVAERTGRTELTVTLAGDATLASLGLRVTVRGARKYLRNGYTSWDGSFFVAPDASRVATDAKAASGYSMTALLPTEGQGTLVMGFRRHDRYQSRFRFSVSGDAVNIDIETLIDHVPPRHGETRSETLVVFGNDAVEEGLRHWARLVASDAPLPPRIPARRITGWCSWYNLYASLSEPVLLEHLEAAARYRDKAKVPFDIFLVDDGFTPEMGDWLEFKPQLPNGIRPVLDAARNAGFTPGLWIAPFMVGNRSKLYAAHPDWVVKSRATGKPLAPMTFYGEFRWHKRSEEYYVLDVTHPEAEAYIRRVFRIWAHDWDVGYFKTDFMHLGSIYGPDEAVWHEAGLSRIAIWMKMARLIRDEIGDALWLCCGAPLLPPIGLCDAMRIGRDVGVKWSGDQSAESLLRDQSTRNYMHGIFWQADPDCVLLRERFHELSDAQVDSLATFAGLAGGLAMTSDQLDEVPPARRDAFASLIGDATPYSCDFPELGNEPDGVLVQRIVLGNVAHLNLFNTTGQPVSRTIGGVVIDLAPYQSRQVDAP